MRAYDGMPLLGDDGGAFAGMRLDDAIERKMDLLLGSYHSRDESIDAINKGIADAFATPLVALISRRFSPLESARRAGLISLCEPRAIQS